MSEINIGVTLCIWFVVAFMAFGMFKFWFEKGIPENKLQHNNSKDTTIPEEEKDTEILDEEDEEDTEILEEEPDETEGFNIEED